MLHDIQESKHSDEDGSADETDTGRHLHLHLMIALSVLIGVLEPNAAIIDRLMINWGILVDSYTEHLTCTMYYTGFVRYAFVYLQSDRSI